MSALSLSPFIYTFLVIYIVLPVISLAVPAPEVTTPASVSTAPNPQPTVCGDIINSGNVTFDANVAYECLISVPFDSAVATRFIKYLNDTIQFQSNLAYLKNPPASYQQPAVDIIEGLRQIQRDVDGGVFPNQYVFEATLQNLIYSAHDDHLYLNAGILAVFTFASPYSIISASADGQEIPKVFVKDDVLTFQNGSSSSKPSPISTINGQDVTDYLSQLAALNAVGTLESHADWNSLMSSPALDIQYGVSIFEGFITFYPGQDITILLENGTQLGPTPWLAIYNSQGDTGPLATGGDFYNFFVLGLYPASYDPNVSVSSPSSTASALASATGSAPPSLSDAAYPSIPDVAQPDLGDTGVLSGYFLHDILTAVLSIPSFEASDAAIGQFSDTIGLFLNQSKQAGMEKVLIDVQQNSGGITFLAIDAFKQFFPSIDPFDGSRLRAQPMADTLGNTFTNAFEYPSNDSTYYDLSTSDWVATDLLDADTGDNFTSWEQLFGPHSYNGDSFTTVQRYNLSSPVYDEVASGGIVVYGYDDRQAILSQATYEAKDIAILTDGLCSSACALFMELMHHEAGVQTVVVGGRPTYGPMQAPSGSRGAQMYTTDSLDVDFSFAIETNLTTSNYLPNRSDTGVYITYATFNLRDQIRKGEDTPLQFAYLAANCRIFYTLNTVYNFTNLWTYAANAIWTNPQLCVQGSTGYASSSGAPSGAAVNANVSHNITGIVEMSGVDPNFYAKFSGQELDGPVARSSTKGKTCRSNSDCTGGGLVCKSVCVETCSPQKPACRNCDFRQGFCPPPARSGQSIISHNRPGIPGHHRRVV